MTAPAYLSLDPRDVVHGDVLAGPTPLDTPCREYPNRNHNGYGRRSTEFGRILVHRWVWIKANGPIPEGLCVMHRCDNPPCYRIDHLRLGTIGDNTRDMIAKGRDLNQNKRKTHCPCGLEYDYIYTKANGRIQRRCTPCQSDYQRARRARLREVAA